MQHHFTTTISVVNLFHSSHHLSASPHRIIGFPTHQLITHTPHTHSQCITLFHSAHHIIPHHHHIAHSASFNIRFSHHTHIGVINTSSFLHTSFLKNWFRQTKFIIGWHFNFKFFPSIQKKKGVQFSIQLVFPFRLELNWN